MIYSCCDENRRALVAADGTLNGIDWLEVLDTDAPANSPRQRTLMLRLLKPVPAGLTVENVRIDGGERIRQIGIEWVGIASAPPAAETSAAEQAFFSSLDAADQVLLVRTDSEGDHSRYCLQLFQSDSEGMPVPLTDFDPRLSSVDFSFKVECPSEFDCKPDNDCPEESKTSPDINYLARDYASLRRFITDRLSRQMPGWQDRSPADLTTTLAELIAYVGDFQHYQLDAIATEAYLHSARRRSSLRRHALLVDYKMHEGCNARSWLQVQVNGGPFTVPEGLAFYTRVPGLPARLEPDSSDVNRLLQAEPLVFESMHDVQLRQQHNSFEFYSWGDERCCLAVGATQATLRGHWPDLAVGDVLVFQEIKGPLTADKNDADPGHRQAVRLTQVNAFEAAAPRTDPLANPDDGTFTEITEIRWHADDALSFPLCLSSQTDEAHGSVLIDGVSIALGNMVLVDHGRSVTDEALGIVPAAQLHYPTSGSNACQQSAPEPLPPRFQPTLAQAPVTQQGTVFKSVLENGVRQTKRLLFDPLAAASAALKWQTADAVPKLLLESTQGSSNEFWQARQDLLDSRDNDHHFVLEIEEDGSSQIRFGDDQLGRRPDTGMSFAAHYRIGNGPQGNVGAEAIAHLISTEQRIVAVTNPLPASGGLPSETSKQVRRRAPQAFRTQQRAVTPADYAEVSERLEGVQRAAAGLRWTGSWHTVFTTIDRQQGEPVDATFANTVIEHLDRYRMAGHDVRVKNPHYVSLEIDMLVCVDRHYFRSDVRLALLDVFSNRTRADGTLGLFHADNFSFGQTVFVSPLYAAARSVAGVASVQITRFQRQGQDDASALADGFMKLGELEIARLDNDANFPEHGVLRFDLHGGK